MEEYMKFEKEASRLEVLIIRPLFSIIIGIVVCIYGLIASICISIQWLVVFITGARSEGLNNPIKTYIEYLIQVYPYMYNLTDERPELGHKNVKLFLEVLGSGNQEEILKFEKEASRLEVLIIRPIYSFIVMIVLGIYGLIAGICVSIQWLVVFITGTRSEGLNSPIKNFIGFIIQAYPYFYNLTDERPELIPENVNIYVE